MTAPFTAADTSRSHSPTPQTASQANQAAPTVSVGASVDHLTETYQAHYSSLLRLAALLLDDTASCEDVVQEAFIRVHSARRRLRDPDKTLAYLRQTVVNLSRSTLRRRILGLRLLQKPMPDAASAEEGAYDALERDELIVALRGLQRRQREVLVLRYFSDMTEAQVADTLGISVGSVKAYGSRGLAALRQTMDGDGLADGSGSSGSGSGSTGTGSGTGSGPAGTSGGGTSGGAGTGTGQAASDPRNEARTQPRSDSRSESRSEGRQR